MQEQGEQQPRSISTDAKLILKQIWKAKDIAPRIQTFAWRLIRRALPTGKRMGKYSKHISKLCARCGVEEDELHILFNCTFARAAWFARPWFIRIDQLLENSNSISTILLNLVNSNHPHATLSNIFTFMWCLWKCRNDKLFQRKESSPIQVFHAAQAIINSLEIETQTNVKKEMQVHHERGSSYEGNNYMQGSTIDISKLSEENIIFIDASWQPHNSMREASNTKACLGVYMQVSHNGCRIRAKISAIVAQATSALQAEAYGLKLAALILYRLSILDATILTDNITLAKAAVARSI